VTTYTISGSVATTAKGDRYEICEKGNVLEYKGASSSSETGTFSMTKR
jgi:hypothetical protein